MCPVAGLCLPPILIPLRQSLLPLLRPLHAMWCLPSTAPEGVPEEKEALKGPVASIWISLGILVLAFVVILPLPNASATLFGITSATGVSPLPNPDNRTYLLAQPPQLHVNPVLRIRPLLNLIPSTTTPSLQRQHGPPSSLPGPGFGISMHPSYCLLTTAIPCTYT